MLESTAVSWLLTLVFVLTGSVALGRLAALVSGTARGGSRLAELSHLVMSVAMVAMIWAWSGGPASPSGVLQIVVFGAFTPCFLALVVRPGPGHDRVGWGYHAVMAGSMVWMVAAMPLLMPGMDMASGAGGHSAHSGHGGAAAGTGSPVAASTAAPGWAAGISVGLTVLLAAAVVLWGARALRPARARDHAPVDRTPAVVAVGTAHDGAPAPVDPALVSGAADRAHITWTEARTDAGCHAAMSLGMALMLVLML